MSERGQWILRAVDWLDRHGDRPVVIAMVIAVIAVVALAVTGQL
jgi:hypothetical protein